MEETRHKISEPLASLLPQVAREWVPPRFPDRMLKTLDWQGTSLTGAAHTIRPQGTFASVMCDFPAGDERQLAFPFIELSGKPVSGTTQLLTAFVGSTWSQTERTDFLKRGTGLGLRHLRTNREVFLWNLHLESALNGSSIASRREFVRNRLRPVIEASRRPGRAELIVGDFNLPPYDEVLMAPGGLWANRSLEIARHHEKIATVTRLPLFNPSWALLGIHYGTCGTYYRSQQPDGEGPWHVIDQALSASNQRLHASTSGTPPRCVTIPSGPVPRTTARVTETAFDLSCGSRSGGLWSFPNHRGAPRARPGRRSHPPRPT